MLCGVPPPPSHTHPSSWQHLCIVSTALPPQGHNPGYRVIALDAPPQKTLIITLKVWFKNCSEWRRIIGWMMCTVLRGKWYEDPHYAVMLTHSLLHVFLIPWICSPNGCYQGRSKTLVLRYIWLIKCVCLGVFFGWPLSHSLFECIQGPRFLCDVKEEWAYLSFSPLSVSCLFGLFPLSPHLVIPCTLCWSCAASKILH